MKTVTYKIIIYFRKKQTSYYSPSVIVFIVVLLLSVGVVAIVEVKTSVLTRPTV